MVNATFHHGEMEAVTSELGRIFGDDLEEVRLVCDDVMEQSGEYYCFLRCDNYLQHVDGLVESPAIARVVPSYQEPSLLSDVEVQAFAASAEEYELPGDFAYGDIVRITTGVLEGLVGLVIEPGEKRCKVLIRLFMKSMTRSMPATSIELVSNVLTQTAIPPFTQAIKRSSLFRRDQVGKAKEAVESIVNSDKIYRRKHRTHQRARL